LNCKDRTYSKFKFSDFIAFLEDRCIVDTI
jgi:hypothetical protein